MNVSGAYLKHNGLLHYADCKVKQKGYGKPPTPYGVQGKDKFKGGKIMTLIELQNVLGGRVEVTLREDLTPEERQTENEQSSIIVELAKQMINNGDLILRTEKLMAQTKNLAKSFAYELIAGEEYVRK